MIDFFCTFDYRPQRRIRTNFNFHLLLTSSRLADKVKPTGKPVQKKILE